MTKSTKLLLLALLLGAAIALAAILIVFITTGEDGPSNARAATPTLFASLDTSIPEANTNGGTIVLDSSKHAEGTGSARATVTGTGASYARNVFRGFTFQTGDDGWAGGYFWIRKADEDGGYLSISRFDDCCAGDPGATSQTLGIESYSNSATWHVQAGQYSTNSRTVTPEFNLPNDTWTWIEMHVKPGTSGLIEVEVDGTRVASAVANVGTRFSRLRQGVVAVGSSGIGPLWIDRLSFRPTRLGPLGAPPPPPPPPPTALEWPCNQGTCYWDATTKEVKKR